MYYTVRIPRKGTTMDLSCYLFVINLKNRGHAKSKKNIFRLFQVLALFHVALISIILSVYLNVL